MRWNLVPSIEVFWHLCSCVACVAASCDVTRCLPVTHIHRHTGCGVEGRTCMLHYCCKLALGKRDTTGLPQTSCCLYTLVCWYYVLLCVEEAPCCHFSRGQFMAAKSGCGECLLWHAHPSGEEPALVHVHFPLSLISFVLLVLAFASFSCFSLSLSLFQVSCL